MTALILPMLKRNWRLAGTIAAFAVFTFIHLAFFRPTVDRYRAALVNVGGIEAVFNPGGGEPLLPPRVYSLITENSLAPQDAVERGASGALGVILLEELDRMASRTGLDIVASNPGQVSQDEFTAQIRARIVLSGTYSDLIGFFDEMSSSHSLIVVERFEIKPARDGSDLMELWLSRLYLKQAEQSP